MIPNMCWHRRDDHKNKDGQLVFPTTQDCPFLVHQKSAVKWTTIFVEIQVFCMLLFIDELRCS